MNNWETRKRPFRLEKRFEFDSYEDTRDFLDRLGDYCESMKRFPDISFAKTYVNITLRPESQDIDAQLSDIDFKFAAAIDGLLN